MRGLLFIAFIFLLNACKTSNLLVEKKEFLDLQTDSIDTLFRYNPNYQYHIRKDDKLSISVWGQDELSVGSVYGIYNSNEVYGKWLMVDSEGRIELPKIGSMSVLNFTQLQLKDTLKKCYAKWILNPIVDIKVLNREIAILGEVKNPQVFTVDKDRNTLLELISKSGGLEFYANIKHVKILRQDGENVRLATIDLSKANDLFLENIALYPGDVVIVPSKKYKEFDKRASVIIPLTTTISAAAILLSFF